MSAEPMRLLIDIGHPAHVHFFKHAVWEWKKRGHHVSIIARDKDIAIQLLELYNFDFHCISACGKGLFGLFKELIIRDKKLYCLAKELQPDILTAIGGASIAHIGRLIGKPSIVFTDTETARLSNKITFPFASVVCTPSCYAENIGKKQVRYEGYHELAYLHTNRFTPNPIVLRELGLTESDAFFIVRFVGWGAAHDISERGMLPSNKIRIVKELAKYGRVFISSEGELPDPLKKYKSSIRFDKMHDVMAFATLLIGESATMASECAMLGVPSLFISSETELGCPNEEEKRYGLIFNFSDEKQDEAFEKMVELLNTPNLKEIWQQRRKKMLSEKIDVTAWMLDFIENYPGSLADVRKGQG